MCLEAKHRGATIFLSSHILSEVEHISDRVGIIRSGRLIRTASLHELHDIRVHEVEIEFAGLPPVDAIRAAAGVDHVEIRGTTVRCTVRGTFLALMRAIDGSEVVNFSSHEPSLEEVFLTYYREGPAPTLEEAVAATGS